MGGHDLCPADLVLLGRIIIGGLADLRMPSGFWQAGQRAFDHAGPDGAPCLHRDYEDVAATMIVAAMVIKFAERQRGQPHIAGEGVASARWAFHAGHPRADRGHPVFPC